MEKHYILSGKDRKARKGSSCLSYNLFAMNTLSTDGLEKEGSHSRPNLSTHLVPLFNVLILDLGKGLLGNKKVGFRKQLIPINF